LTSEPLLRKRQNFVLEKITWNFRKKIETQSHSSHHHIPILSDTDNVHLAPRCYGRISHER